MPHKAPAKSMHSKRRQLASKSLLAFAVAYGKKNVPLVHICDFHKELCRELDRALLPRQRFVGAFPREHGKTTIGTALMIAYAAATGMKKHIIIIGANQTEAEMKLDMVMSVFSWPEMQEDFGSEITPMIDERKNRDVRNRTYEVVLQNGCLLLAKEGRAKLRGRNFRNQRPDLVVLDDPEDDDNVDSEEWRRKFMRWVNKTILNGIDSNLGSLVWMGTILHKDSPLSQVLNPRGEEKKSAHWRRLTYRAIPDEEDLDEQGLPKVLWPGRWSYQKLLDKEAEIGRAAFRSEYMNDPRDPDAQLWKEEDWIFYDPSHIVQIDGRWGVLQDGVRVFKKFDRIAMAVDPATGLGRRHDYTSITVKGRVQGSRKTYMLHQARMKVTVSGMIKEMQRLRNHWAPDVMTLENVNQDAMRQAVVESGLPVKSVKPTNAKKERIEIYYRHYENGSILVPDPAKVPSIRYFMEEAEDYPTGSHDDQLDSAAQCQEAIGTTNSLGAMVGDERQTMFELVGAY